MMMIRRDPSCAAPCEVEDTLAPYSSHPSTVRPLRRRHLETAPPRGRDYLEAMHLDQGAPLPLELPKRFLIGSELPEVLRHFHPTIARGGRSPCSSSLLPNQCAASEGRPQSWGRQPIPNREVAPDSKVEMMKKMAFGQAGYGPNDLRRPRDRMKSLEVRSLYILSKRTNIYFSPSGNSRRLDTWPAIVSVSLSYLFIYLFILSLSATVLPCRMIDIIEAPQILVRRAAGTARQLTQ